MALRAEQITAHLSTNSIDDMLSTKIQHEKEKIQKEGDKLINSTKTNTNK